MNTIALYIAAGIAEIGECFAFWSWLRHHSGPHNRYGYCGSQIGENVESLYNKIEEEDLTRAAHKLNTLITLTPPSHQTPSLKSL